MAKNKNKRGKPSIFVYILAVLVAIGTMVASYMVFKLVSGIGVLPKKYIDITMYVLIGINVFFSIFAFLPNVNNLNKILQILFEGIICAALVVGIIKIPEYQGRIERIFTNVPEEGTLNFSVYTLADSNLDDVSDLNGVEIGIQQKLDTEYQGYSLKVITKELDGNEVPTKEYEDLYTAVEDLYNGNVKAILLNESYETILTGNNDFEDFKTRTKKIYTIEHKVQLTYDTTAVENITEEPFTVLIGGNDSWDYDEILDTAGYQGRTDVNMLVTVNPTTKQVLIITIPRDSYVPLWGEYYAMDKLTHATVYGISDWIETVSYFMDVDINYFVRLNFASLINVVDALGGIDIYNPYYFETTFENYVPDENGNHVYREYTFEVGDLHLDGAAALTYCRERKYYNEEAGVTGDEMRNQHQAMVLKEIINKVTSVSVITHVTDLLKAVEGTFATDLNINQIYALVQMQLDDMATWNINQFGLSGYADMRTSYAMGAASGQLYSVFIVDSSDVNKAQSLIDQVIAGQIITLE
ncbi:MAG: LCP family protein [Erysipelotrichaceae bacterium]|nr:LCP family protein [Erysipelotrichaceae bacterium]